MAETESAELRFARVRHRSKLLFNSMFRGVFSTYCFSLTAIVRYNPRRLLGHKLGQNEWRGK